MLGVYFDKDTKVRDVNQINIKGIGRPVTGDRIENN
jgi:hypothetical protein